MQDQGNIAVDETIKSHHLFCSVAHKTDWEEYELNSLQGLLAVLPCQERPKEGYRIDILCWATSRAMTPRW